MDVVHLIVDAVARIVVPIIVVLLGRRPVDQIVKNRSSNIENQMREQAKSGNDEEQAFMDKILKEVFARREMRWFW